MFSFSDDDLTPEVKRFFEERGIPPGSTIRYRKRPLVTDEMLLARYKELQAEGIGPYKSAEIIRAEGESIGLPNVSAAP